MNALRLLCLTSLSLALLSGCAVNPNNHRSRDTIGGVPPQEAKGDLLSHLLNTRDPLLDAPFRAILSCESEQPLTVINRTNDVRFACKDVGVSATLNELRDAGWRVLSLDLGSDIETNEHVGFPMKITIQKLF